MERSWGGRLTAIAAFGAAGTLAGLILLLASRATVPPILLDALSVGAAAGAMVVVILAYAGTSPSPWGQAGRALALSGMTLVLAGDALQAVATRGATDSAVLWAVAFAIRDGIGNALFFTSLLILGAMLWSQHRWLAGLAAATGLLGFLDMAFGVRLGLPPHLSFLLLVVWLIAVGAAWWRTPPSEQVILSGRGRVEVRS